MNALTAALKEELNVDMVTVFGLSIPESVVVSWGIMAFLVIGSILLTRNLRVDHITKRQAILETVVTTINDFFVGLLGESGKRYVPYLMSVALYIGCSNLIGVFGIKPPTKDLNVTAALALMSICLIEYAGIHARGGVGFLKSLAAPTPVMTPMNILEIAIRPTSLCMRLFGNIFRRIRYHGAGQNGRSCRCPHSTEPVFRCIRRHDTGDRICIPDNTFPVGIA